MGTKDICGQTLEESNMKLGVTSGEHLEIECWTLGERPLENIRGILGEHHGNHEFSRTTPGNLGGTLLEAQGKLRQNFGQCVGNAGGTSGDCSGTYGLPKVFWEF